ncbi:MAG: PASTA domain-containing protein [Dysgonamonadaceae bacterium]|jgi:beta-lactam-binding protein with PASTA domain|nr:PASTA domain-containing protein [Dysgonamonadaceae bacterium]
MKFKTIINNVFVKNMLSAVVLLAVLIVGTLRWLDGYTRHGDAVVVPDVIGMSPAQALPLLEKAGLRYEIDSIHVKNAKAGTIVDLIPSRGSRVKSNRIIFISLNAFSPEILTVPEVKDLSQRQALALLKSSGFDRVEVSFVPSAYEDLVIGLEYNSGEVWAGTKIPATALLTLKVSSGAMVDENTESTDSVPSDESWF